MLELLKDRLGSAAARLPDDVLERFLSYASGLSDLSDVAVTLALALCYQRLATDAAANFKYSQGAESVDKTAEAGNWQKLFETTWSSLPESIRERGAPSADTFVLGAASPGGADE